MSNVDLVYAHVPCPKCKEGLLPLTTWVSPTRADEDGHSDGIEVNAITCAKCGELHDEDGVEQICDMVIDAMYHAHDYRKEHRPMMVEIGSIYSLYPKSLEVVHD